jgi:ribosomal protein S20
MSARDFSELMSSDKSSRRNSINGQQDDESNDSMSSSLRNRMKLFEENIQKNKKFGVEKKIF